MGSSGGKKINWTITLQIITIVSVVISAIFTHYSQKNLIEYKEEITKKEPSLLGVSMHGFLPEKYFESKKVNLINYQAIENGKSKGNVVYINDYPLTEPVFINVSLKNYGNTSAKNVEIHLSSLAKGLLRGRLVPVDQYSQCTYDFSNNNLGMIVRCPEFKQGQDRIFRFRWLPELRSKDVAGCNLNQIFTTEFETDGFLSTKVYSENSPEAVMLKSSFFFNFVKIKS